VTREEVQKARAEAAAIASAILAGRLGAVMGAIYLNRLRSLVDVPDDDPDFETFLVIDSECDALPFGEARNHWAPEALAVKEPEVAEAEQWAIETGIEAFRNVVARFSPSV
jgi:hypothetical protein